MQTWRRAPWKTALVSCRESTSIFPLAFVVGAGTYFSCVCEAGSVVLEDSEETGAQEVAITAARMPEMKAGEKTCFIVNEQKRRCVADLSDFYFFLFEIESLLFEVS